MAVCLDRTPSCQDSLDTELGLVDRGYKMEVIYCSSNQDYDSRDKKTRQAGIGEA